MEAIFSNDDLAMEILSRFSALQLSRFKCVSKRWKNLISDPSFLRLHHQRSQLRGITTLLIDQRSDITGDRLRCRMSFFTTCGSFFEDDRRVPIMIRDSFPASGVVIMGSSNGLVCCRSRQTLEQPMLVIFICNPITREWISLRPTNCHVGHIFAFAFYPFGSSSNKASCFKVVSIQRQKYDQNSYSFVIYSSETGKWKTSMEVCHCEDDLNENKYIHIKGRFYWLTKKQRIITFDLEEELSGVIIALGPMLRYGVRNSDCLGDSDGYLHYACVDESDLRVWMLKDCQKLDWVLKHQLNLDQFRVEGQVMTDYLQFSIRRVGCIPKDDIFAPGYLALGILTFYDEFIYMMRWGRLESYNFRNGVLKRHHMLHAPFLDHYNYVPATVLPYLATLAANGVLKVKQNSIDDLISVPATVLPCSATSAMSGLLGLIRSCGFVASNSSSYQGRRKRKRIKPVSSPHF
ncbi:F-box protein At5g49610-like [Quercus lobata]|uniref:F-box protein n=1 Tax=Quercus lobata TaxID=97700 RepID=A0A7N2MDT5_QUELO|nr:F-box protein At5g49610-like [Quercus lobata]XP_030929661.1 F-box protein At5g49610-like [Quercus lobata]